MGIAVKLRAALASNPVLLPTAKTSVVGRQIRLLAGHASLSQLEALLLATWVEEVYDEDTLTRFEQPLPTPITAHPSFGGSVSVGTPAPAPAPAPPPAPSPTFAPMLDPPMVGAGAPLIAPRPPMGASIAVTEQQREDVQLHGFDAGTIAILTFAMHTARLPPEGHEEVKYGVDPSSMTRLYKAMKNAHGTLLWDLVTSEKTTFRDFQG